MEEDGAVRLDSGGKDDELEHELRRLRSSVDNFLKSQSGLDTLLENEADADVYDEILADKRLKNARWLSDLVLRKIEKTLKDVEIA